MAILSFKKLIVLVTFAVLGAQGAENDPLGDNPFGGDPFGGLSVDSLPPPSLDATPPQDATAPQDATPPQEVTSPQNEDNSTANTPVPETELPPLPATTEQIPQDNQPQSTFSQIESSDLTNMVQNAVIEGIQITTDKGETPDEKIVSGYFIFRDKPSSYFYEVKLREKKIVFEFNDTKTGASPVPSVSEAPIKGFTIVSDKVDVNKDVKGLKPEYHDVIRVIFDLEGVPQIHVNDEYSIITFSFKWSKNPQMLSKYVVKDKTPKIILWSSVGVGGVGAAALAYFLLKPKGGDQSLGDVPIDDIPDRPNPNQ